MDKNHNGYHAKQVFNMKKVKDFNTIEKIMKNKHLSSPKMGSGSKNCNNESINMNNNIETEGNNMANTSNLEQSQSNIKSQDNYNRFSARMNEKK